MKFVILTAILEERLSRFNIALGERGVMLWDKEEQQHIGPFSTEDDATDYIMDDTNFD